MDKDITLMIIAFGIGFALLITLLVMLIIQNTQDRTIILESGEVIKCERSYYHNGITNFYDCNYGLDHRSVINYTEISKSG